MWTDREINVTSGQPDARNFPGESGIERGSAKMDSEMFDRWTQGLNARLSRRGLSGIAAGTLATLSLTGTADAKKKKKKKKKPSPPVSPAPSPLPPTPTTSCQNLGTACGNTAVCVCALDKTSTQICQNQFVPPDGIKFNNRPCISNANCVAGTVCNAQFNVCATACVN